MTMSDDRYFEFLSRKIYSPHLISNNTKWSF